MHPSLGSPRVVRDTQWLTLEVCREFVRNKCSRGEDECKFAHPPPQVEVQNCKVICCFDSLLGRCHRIDPVCKYFHPPQHLKEQLSQARRNSVSNRPQHLLNSSFMPGVMPLQNSLVLHNSPSYNTPTEERCRLLESLINPSYLPLLRPARSDRLEVCREFQRGVCSRQTSDCKFAHPPTGVCLDADNYVTVCMDFLKDRCSRETCKYFHPPLHLRSPPLQPPLQQQLYQQQLYQQQQQQQHLLQQLQQQQQHRSSISLPGTSMMANLGTNSSVVAWPVLQNVQTQPNSLVLSLLSLHHQQQQQQQQQQLQQQHQLLQQQLQQQQQQPAMQSLQQQQILNSSLAGLLPTSSFGPLQ